MKQKITIILMFGFSLCSSQTFAAQERSLESTLAKPYISFETGYAFSLQSNLDVSESKNPASGFVWDHANEGWNSKLGNSVLVGADFGINLTRLVSLELAYNYRPSFSYAKLQTVYATSSIGTRVRNFDLDNQTLMLNSVFHLSSLTNTLTSWQQRTGIEPFINFGVGAAKNTISNFYSVSVDKQPGLIFSKMVDKNTFSFAGQVGAGLNVIFNPSWSMKFGYRFLYAGNFKTQDYITDDPDGQHMGVPGSGNAANPWSGKLKANEIYAGLSYTW